MKTIKEITEYNIDDFIREEKRKGKEILIWNKREWKILKRFYAALVPCKHGWFCLCSDGTEEYLKKTFKSGLTLMGVKHYLKK